MPLISTRGAASARGFGLFAAKSGCCLNDGNKAIFALGGGGFTTVRNKYTYATCASTACGVAAQSFASSFQSAAGNNTRGIFALGEPQGSGIPSNTRDKYTYSGCTSTSSGVGTASAPTERGAAAGNNTRGIFALGSTYNCCTGFTPVVTRNKYTYASCTSTASCVATATLGSQRGSAAGNSTRGIFTLGCIVGVGASTTRNKHTYACCTSTAVGVGAASAAAFWGSAAGNSTRGVFALGYVSPPANSNVRNKYTYACCTSTASGVAVASAAARQGSAAGNSTRGIFAIGINCCVSAATRDKYTYSSCTSTSSGVGAASNLNSNGAAASWATCVNT